MKTRICASITALLVIFSLIVVGCSGRATENTPTETPTTAVTQPTEESTETSAGNAPVMGMPVENFTSPVIPAGASRPS